jgi:hypothetical protein
MVINPQPNDHFQHWHQQPSNHGDGQQMMGNWDQMGAMAVADGPLLLSPDAPRLLQAVINAFGQLQQLHPQLRSVTIAKPVASMHRTDPRLQQPCLDTPNSSNSSNSNSSSNNPIEHVPYARVPSRKRARIVAIDDQVPANTTNKARANKRPRHTR